ncbi:TPA: helix-turn-helix domain-containing protein, partial [Streptococcus suis]
MLCSFLRVTSGRTGTRTYFENLPLIERWKNENKSNREIAGLLGKAPQTIHNEIKRG